MNKPLVKKGDWIIVGKTINGLVMDVSPEYISVGYHQNGIKAIKEDVVWKNGRWEFMSTGPNGSYLRGPEEAAVKRGPPHRP